MDNKPKLNDTQRWEICYLYLYGKNEDTKTLARKYSVSATSIRKTLQRKGVATRNRSQSQMGERNYMHGRTGTSHHSWRGGRVNRNGYDMVRCIDHPNSCSGYVYEHRLIYEKQIGRYLEHDEVVHHKDGNKLNNCLDNLELIPKSDHQRLHSNLRDRDSDGKFI